MLNKFFFANTIKSVILYLFISTLENSALAKEIATEKRNSESFGLNEFARWFGEKTKKSIVLHPDTSGSVSIIIDDNISEEHAHEVFRAALQVNGLGIIEEDEVIQIIPIRSSVDKAPPESEFKIATSYRKNIPPIGKIPKLPTVRPPSPPPPSPPPPPSLSQLKTTTSLQPLNGILSSQTGSLNTKKPNLSDKDIQVRVVKVKNIAASRLASALKPMLIGSGHLTAHEPTNSLIIADTPRGVENVIEILKKLDKLGYVDITMVPLRFADARGVISVIRRLMAQSSKEARDAQLIRLTADERSNSILMIGDEFIQAQVKKLIKRLDRPLPGEGATQVFYLNYTSAKELEPIIHNLANEYYEMHSASGHDKPSREASIQASESLNALIITGSARFIRTVKSIIDRLDIRRAQVLVEALVVEVNEDLASSIGISMQSNLDDNGVFSGFRFSGGLTPLSSNNSNGVSLGSGLNLGYIRSGDLRGIINLLKTETNANILSTPAIMVLDNESAEILVGESVPFITGSEIGQGNNDPFQTIRRQDIGVTLKVKPRINKDNSLTLEIKQTVENISQANVETADIVTSKREINTRVLIENSETLVLGGLIRDEITSKENKVPFFGDIPLVGKLFRSTDSSTIKKNLMVFIRPVVLHNNNENYRVTQERYQLMSEEQNNFNDKIDHFLLPSELPQLPPLTTSTSDN